MRTMCFFLALIACPILGHSASANCETTHSVSFIRCISKNSSFVQPLIEKNIGHPLVIIYEGHDSELEMNLISDTVALEMSDSTTVYRSPENVDTFVDTLRQGLAVNHDLRVETKNSVIHVRESVSDLPQWEMNILLNDVLSSGSITCAEAISAVRKKLGHDNDFNYPIRLLDNSSEILIDRVDNKILVRDAITLLLQKAVIKAHQEGMYTNQIPAFQIKCGCSPGSKASYFSVLPITY